VNEIQKMLEEIAKSLDNVVSISIVGMDGLVIAEYTSEEGESTESSSARMTTVMTRLVDVFDQVKMGKMVDNLLSTEAGHFLTRYIGDGSVFLSIVCNRGANLGAMRYASKIYDKKIWELLPH
jgi:predicted regulator of Ras-like GTPase activity (Roadblock/LC7/MglB family)